MLMDMEMVGMASDFPFPPGLIRPTAGQEKSFELDQVLVRGQGSGPEIFQSFTLRDNSIGYFFFLVPAMAPAASPQTKTHQEVLSYL